MIFLSLLFIPILIAFGFFLFGRKITVKEFLIHCAIQMLIAGISAEIIYWNDTRDTEILDGSVIQKAREKVSCSHSYSCNCYTTCSGSGSNQSCSTYCQTCYEHPYDIDWAVYMSINYRLTIDRTDRRGLDEPSRWSAVKVGEPVSIHHDYTNYIKAAPGTLFKHQGLTDKYKKYLNNYPGNIYDYYRHDHSFSINGSLPEQKEWNDSLADLGARIGASKQVHPMVIYVVNLPEDFSYALEESWIGGKKNDALLIIGGDQEGNIKWVRVLAWTNSEMFKVKVRDDVMGYGNIKNRLGIVTAFEYSLWNFYIRKPMKDFEYLSASIVPSVKAFTIATIAGILISIMIGIFMYSF